MPHYRSRRLDATGCIFPIAHDLLPGARFAENLSLNHLDFGRKSGWISTQGLGNPIAYRFACRHDVIDAAMLGAALGQRLDVKLGLGARGAFGDELLCLA